ncbi:MAG TPA: SPOR domain-containing protein [Bacteroidota bacterium]|nr:SPOR domain-containing protein [Bacteroidota bacterium]
MHGFGIIPKIKLRYLFFLFGVFIAWGCSGSKETSGKETSGHTMREFLAEYEPTFNPSDYDPDITVLKQREEDRHNALVASAVVSTALPETIPGFRVQVLFTQEIDEANRTRDSLSSVLPDDWIYIVYDVPYYKVRVGNFADRPSANQILKKLTTLGYTDAWIVPDNVIKNPPARFPDIDIEPERPFDQRR